MCHKPDESQKAKLIPIIQCSKYLQYSRQLSSLMPTWPCTTSNSKSVTWHLCVTTVCTLDDSTVVGDSGICTWISESRNFMELVNVRYAYQEMGVNELQLGGWRHTVHCNCASWWLLPEGGNETL